MIKFYDLIGFQVEQDYLYPLSTTRQVLIKYPSDM